ncbi:MAG TPA: hypothetical protein PKE08_00980 [Candidatus Paceibacterota bacterium]|nr:hypothetical protein [Candidatus Paceibacterota bacterium]
MEIRKVLLSVYQKIIELIFPESKEAIFLKNISNFDLFKILNEYKKNYLFKEIYVKNKNYKIHSVFFYKNKLIKEMISQFKFKNKKNYAGVFGFFMAEKIENFFKNKNEIDFYQEFILSFVPVHEKRKKERGFDQCELICDSIFKNIVKNGKLKVRYEKKLIEKKIYTQKQSWKNKNDRQKNISGVFYLNKKFENKLIGQNIILIDDIVTTGYTAGEIIKILDRENIKRIFIFTIAK